MHHVIIAVEVDRAKVWPENTVQIAGDASKEQACPWKSVVQQLGFYVVKVLPTHAPAVDDDQ
jgi:hypothetical protein